MGFTVTEKAMRPVSKLRECFYCEAPIGGEHRDTCVLVQKVAKVKVTVWVPHKVPAHWDARQVEYHMNETSWCASNILNDIEAEEKADRCMCALGARFEVEELGEDVFLEED